MGGGGRGREGGRDDSCLGDAEGEMEWGGLVENAAPDLTPKSLDRGLHLPCEHTHRGSWTLHGNINLPGGGWDAKAEPTCVFCCCLT